MFPASNRCGLCVHWQVAGRALFPHSLELSQANLRRVLQSQGGDIIHSCTAEAPRRTTTYCAPSCARSRIWWHADFDELLKLCHSACIHVRCERTFCNTLSIVCTLYALCRGVPIVHDSKFCCSLQHCLKSNARLDLASSSDVCKKHACLKPLGGTRTDFAAA